MNAHDLTPKDNDDPVPEAVIEAIEQMTLYDLYTTLRHQIPYRKTRNFNDRLKTAQESNK